MNFNDFKTQYAERVWNYLDQVLPAANTSPPKLHQAMRYSTLNPGKRTRPLLAYATAQICGGEADSVDAIAAALEMIHAYSLIHDDLPCMDDDDLRRGLPTCHIQFDEATAVLAGDALQTQAFIVLATQGKTFLASEQLLQIISELSLASGAAGMGGGQAIDLAATGQNLSLSELETMHLMKTGALIKASVLCGYYASVPVSQQNPAHVEAFANYAQAIGLAFQIRDDILDIESDTETLGKPQGSDLLANKATYPRILGLQGAKEHAQKQYQLALEALAELPYNTALLKDFARDIVERVK